MTSVQSAVLWRPSTAPMMGMPNVLPQTYYDELLAKKSVGVLPPLASKDENLAQRRFFFEVQSRDVASSLFFKHYDVLLPRELTLLSQKDHLTFYYTDFLSSGSPATEFNGKFAASSPFEKHDVKDLQKWVSEIVPRTRVDAYPLLILCQNLLRDLLSEKHLLFLEELDGERTSKRALEKEFGDLKGVAERLATQLQDTENRLQETLTALAKTRQQLDVVTRQFDAAEVKNRGTNENQARQIENLENSLASMRADRDRYIQKAKDAQEQLSRMFAEKDRAVTALAEQKQREEALLNLLENTLLFGIRHAPDMGMSEPIVKELYDLSLSILKGACGAKNAYLAELKKGNQGPTTLRYISASAGQEFMIGRELPQGQGVSFDAVESKEPVLVPNLEQNSRVLCFRDDVRRTGVYLGLPLKVFPGPSGTQKTPDPGQPAPAAEPNVVGLLGLDKMEAPNPTPFSPDDIRFAEKISNHVAQLYAALQQRLKAGETEVVDDSAQSAESRLAKRKDKKTAMEKDIFEAKGQEIREMKKYAAPPDVVRTVWKLVFTLLGEKGLKDLKDPIQEWTLIRKLMVIVHKDQDQTIFGRLKGYDPTRREEKDRSSHDKFKAVKELLEGLTPQTVAEASAAASSLFQWVKLMVEMRDISRAEDKEEREIRRAAKAGDGAAAAPKS